MKWIVAVAVGTTLMGVIVAGALTSNRTERASEAREAVVTPKSGCQDIDGDGYGLGCSLGADCNDLDGAIHPGRPEVCNFRDDDCNALKTRLEEYAAHAGLATRTHQSRNQFSVVNRILVEELEAWYFGDWEAVRAAYPGVSATIPRKSKFRDPDGIRGGTWEAFERVLQRAGHFRNGLRKIEAAREIAARMDPMRNSSPSFQVFRDAVLELDTGA